MVYNPVVHLAVQALAPERALLLVLTMSRLCALPERTSLRFAMVGDVTVWDPITRRLHLGSTELWVAPRVSVSAVAPGTTVSVIGHIEGSVPRRVVTALSVLAPEGDVTRVRQIILDDLRAVERDLTAMQEVQADAARARDLCALRGAIAAILDLMSEGSGGSH